jgi:hypothetical protein
MKSLADKKSGDVASHKRAIVLGCIVVVLLGILGLRRVISGRMERVTVAPLKPARSAVTRKAVKPVPRVMAPARAAQPLNVSSNLDITAPAEVHAVPQAVVQAMAASLRPRVPPKGERIVRPGIIRNASADAPQSNTTFQTKSERMISRMLIAKPEEMILPVSLGSDFDQDFGASMTNTILIYDDDTAETAAHKADVGWMKVEMMEEVKKGRSPTVILEEYRERHNEIVLFRGEVQKILSALKKEGRTEEAEAFVEESNKLLAPYGVKPLVLYPVFPKRSSQD